MNLLALPERRARNPEGPVVADDTVNPNNVEFPRCTRGGGR
jgi:hypothetical protein